MSYRILIRQHTADLARLFLAAMEDYPFVLLTPSDENLDWENPKAVAGYVNEKSPNLVINFNAQYNRVTEQDLAVAKALASVSMARKLPFLQLSSFRVFYAVNDDAQELPESPVVCAPEAPLCVQLENSVLASDVALVLRLPWLLDGVNGCLFDEINSKLVRGSLGPVSDFHRLTLVHSPYVIRCLIAMIQQIFCGANNWGVFHLRASDSCSEAELVDTIVRMIHNETGSETPTPNVVVGKDEGRLLAGAANLAGRRCTDEFGIQFPSWRHGFKSQIKRWLHDQGMLPDMRKVDR